MHKYKNLAVFLSLLFGCIMFALALAGIKSCAVAPSGTGAGAVCTTENELRYPSCPAGQSGKVIQICSGGNWKESSNTCKAGACSDIVFDKDVAGILTDNCVSCHSGYNTFDVAKTKIDAFITRTTKAPDDPQRMPKAPNAPLTKDQTDTFAAWKTAGLLQSCPNTSANDHITLDDEETAALNDLQSLTPGLQGETRWISVSNISNEGATKDILANFEKAVNKGINSISTARNIVKAVAVGPTKTLFRFNLNDLKLTVAAWNLIEANDPLNLESFTNKGTILKNLTNSKKPILYVSDLNTIIGYSAVINANKVNVYYGIRKTAADLNTFLTAAGVDEKVQLANFQALQVGLNSIISINKNRLLTRFDSNDLFLWQSFDINEVAAASKNLLQFPLLKSASGKATFTPDASEILYSLPNGTLGAALFTALGTRLDFADPTVVLDNVSPSLGFSSLIVSPGSCFRCHNNGLITAKDEVKASVDQNAAQFDLRDVDLVDQLYRDPTNAFNLDIADHAAALQKMGITGAETDPFNLAADSLRKTQTVASVAALLRLRPEEFILGLARSSDGKAQVGQLLSGGTVTFSQLQASLPILIRDLRIGQEPLNPQP